MRRIFLPALAALALATGAAAQGAAPAAPPRNWWQLDPASDRVPGIGVERAYRELLAGRQPRRPVTVAIIDTGVDPAHEDLRGALWTNPRETVGNGRDDDGNGYVDDVHGWNFIGGRDGRNVFRDTYEVTRLYARLRPLYQNADPDTLRGERRAEYALWQEVRADFEPNRAQQAQGVAQLRQIEKGILRIEGLLRTALGGDSLSVARVQALQPAGGEVGAARQAYLQLAAEGITLARVRAERDALERGNGGESGFNPEFDPRAVVGDRYADPADRFYGNPDVRGPFAEHGTHVAGILGALRGNGIGIDGVASGVRLMLLRVVPNGDERDKDVANAIRYAVDHGAQVINMSFGKGFSPEKRWVDEAVRYADGKGVLLVHAAGNDGADLERGRNFPTRTYLEGGEPRHWIEVGASHWNPETLAADFSNWGRRKVDLFAPGVDIRSTVPDNGYEELGGTSMAAPVVSGVAALLLAYYPELSGAQVKQILLESATRHADRMVPPPGGQPGAARVRFGDLSATGGVLNAYEAVRMAERMTAGAARR
jgi:subtilisin family serine protease